MCVVYHVQFRIRNQWNYDCDVNFIGMTSRCQKKNTSICWLDDCFKAPLPFHSHHFSNISHFFWIQVDFLFRLLRGGIGGGGGGDVGGGNENSIEFSNAIA